MKWVSRKILAAEALSTVAIVGRAWITPASGIVLSARPSGLDRVHGFRLLYRLSAVALSCCEGDDSTEVFAVNSSGTEEGLALASEQVGVDKSLKGVTFNGCRELRALAGGVRITNVELEVMATGFGLNFRSSSVVWGFLAANPCCWAYFAS